MAKESPSLQEVTKRIHDAEVARTVLQRYKKRNALLGLGLLTGVVGIYAYSMYAVRQENFLDEEFDRPVGLPSGQDTAQSSGAHGLAADDKT